MWDSLVGDIKLGSRICATGGHKKDLLLHNKIKSELPKWISIQQVLTGSSLYTIYLQDIYFKRDYHCMFLWMEIAIITDAK